MSEEIEETAETEAQGPDLIKWSNIKAIYQGLVEDDNGEPVAVRMKATPEFKDALNNAVFELLHNCIRHARADNRKIMNPDDVPSGFYDQEPDDSQ